ncbi:MFS transporter [Magnetospirillum sp. UT-4]|uniref:MFS transporter n=1 Tax=Magnetospirillum sp. UT-4 TaxID=2681467 RepID=UPI0013804982|nr:MFS transporter [Magnetospirillum sp. UT-4]CAA7612708.1 Major facilitator superfamily MFS_1 [Magnetospirillum sp. UT-4]
MRLDSSRSLLVRLFILAVLVLVPPTAIVSYRALGAFEQGMAPEMDKKAAIVGQDLRTQLERAVGYGVPLERMVGMTEFFAPVLAANPELRYLAVSDPDGRLLYLHGAETAELQADFRTAGFGTGRDGHKISVGPYFDVALPVQAKGGAVIGHLHVGFDRAYVTDRLANIFLDVAVVLSVSLIVAFEVLLFVVFFNITGPLKVAGWVVDRVRRGDFEHVPSVWSGDEVGHFVRAMSNSVRRTDEAYRGLMAYIEEVRTAHFDAGVVARVAEVADRVRFLFRFSPDGRPAPLGQRMATDIRLPLFLFVFAEEMSRSFMPLYAGGLATPLPGLSVEMMTALPIAFFMAAIALASPWAARVTERVGSSRAFVMGMVPAALGYVMTGFVFGLFDLLLWRVVSGVGYALVTVAAQTYISQAAREEQRAQGLGVYVGAVLTASICGTGIGGLLAERIGFGATFFVSGALVVLSGVLLARIMAESEPPAVVAVAARPKFRRLLANWRFTVLMLFAAVPAKMALTGFLFFLVPMILWQSSLTLSEIARMVVLYPLVMAVTSAIASRLSDRFQWRAGLVALGGLIGGIGLLAPVVLDGTLPIAIAIIALGLSHGLSASPQLALIPDVCWTECRAFGRVSIMALVRTIERAGSVAGPLIAAAFIPMWGLNGAVIGLGVLVLALAAFFAIASGAYGSGPHIETEEETA